MKIDVCGAEGDTPKIPAEIVPSYSEVLIDAWILSNDVHQTATESRIRQCIADANDVFRQVGMRFVLHAIRVHQVEDGLFCIDESAQNGFLSSTMFSWGDFTDGLEVFFVDDFVGDSACGIAYRLRKIIALDATATGYDMAHEIGQICIASRG